MQKTPQFVSGSWPLLGHIPSFMSDYRRLFERGRAEHGPIFAVRLPTPVAIVAGSDLNRWFFSETDRSLNISRPYEFLRAAFGNTLLLATKDAYDNQRPLLKALFGNERMAGYLAAMNAEVDRWLERLGPAGEMDISFEMFKLAQNVAGHAFLGPRFEAELGDEFFPAYADLARSLDPIIPHWWPLPKFRRRDRAKVKLRALMAPICQRRRDDPSVYDDVFTIAANTPLADGALLDFETTVELFVGLLFAGHETTASQAAWSIILTLKHPEVAARLREEASAVVHGGPLGARELRGLQLTYNIIDETTRMRPSAQMLVRTVDAPVQVGDTTIPAGWRVMTCAHLSHFSPAKFADAGVFDPDRFSEPRGEGKDPNAIIGFGGGRHKCTGMNFARNEMAVILAKLFATYDLELLTQYTRAPMSFSGTRPTPTFVRYRRRAAVPDARGHDA